jgi:arylsulfatase A-like enzyme
MRTITTTLATFFLTQALTTAPTMAVEESQQTRPNIVFILADDLGWGDLSSNGHPQFRTPNIDNLAREGMAIRQFSVAAPICSPSRAGIITGRFPARFGILYPFQMDRNIAINQPDWLDPRPLTLPRLLQSAGFTTAICGKWHLVEEREKVMTDAPTPAAYGFQTWHLMRGPWESDINPRQSFDAGVAFLKKTTKQPFFLQLTIHEPHVPYFPSPQALAANAHVDERSRRYAASVTDLDNGVGRVLATLQELHLEQDTLVIFTSDNGPARRAEDLKAAYGQYYNSGTTGGLRGYKGQLYEGGVRTPLIVRWPGHVPAGKVDSTSAINGVDLLPTLAAATGTAVPSDWGGDGVNRLEVLKGHPSVRPQPLFWRTTEQESVRDGDWKLVRSRKQGTTELFDLAKDPNEAQDLTQAQPGQAARLADLLQAWTKGLPTEPDPACCSQARKGPQTGLKPTAHD